MSAPSGPDTRRLTQSFAPIPTPSHKSHHRPDSLALAAPPTPLQSYPKRVLWRDSHCGSFTVILEHYNVPLKDGSPGALPMDRKCTLGVYGQTATKGAVLLVPGYASNREIFDMGGGRGRTGPSFSEYLAKRGYDTFSIDLRGTTEAIALGTKRPESLKAHVEVDLPSAIAFVKAVGPYEKVYLIGHSLGGALSCAVAGMCPEDIAGVVHLAGLYHFSLPVFSEAIDLYKAYCPSLLQSTLYSSTSLVTRASQALLSPLLSSVRCLAGNLSRTPSLATCPISSHT
ncbi:Alpha/Beta hydrolase protein [Blyttiomyces helicus]|uniref:Alpha/Beta hydrolase protein n=1 Tax=Blyttiomyces helicus TaxID=388810 RepID=A0A4P9VV97_9FUNG|nr:Alpha/Beta hydrolase protein [Blyttiomyces helicus]|eukprot:RKO83561.1 Alpha/Beta hydrolase protein [Blyttiomyces helicus]